MRFKEWLQQEISIDLRTPGANTANPTAFKQATDSIAKQSIAHDSPKFMQAMIKAPSPPAALGVAAKFAQKGLKKATVNPKQTPTDVASVAGKLVAMGTGQEPKTI